MAKLHDFSEKLEWSHSFEDSPLWETIYKNAFPTYKLSYSVRKDGWAQRGGIDRVIILESGKTITVDEKMRGHDYGDILLEYWSNEEKRVPGWIAKDLACDYIAYAFEPSKKCYILPFQQLRLSWKNKGREWVSKYKRIEAKNIGYTTISVAVPTADLFNELNKSFVVNW